MSGISGLLEEAIALHRAGRLDEAEAGYRRLVETGAARYDALRLLGMLDAQRGRLDRAEALIREAIALQPAAPKAHSNLGSCLQMAGRLAEAVTAYDASLARDPGNAGDHYNRGRALLLLGRHDEALASVDRALALRPDDVEALGNRGLALVGLNRPAEALAACDGALRLAPGHAPAHCNRGLALAAMGRHADAAAAFRRAIELDGRSAEAHHDLAIALKAEGALPESMAADEAAVALDPARLDALMQLVATGAQMCAWGRIAPHRERLLAASRTESFDASPFPLLSLADDPELHRAAARRHRAHRVVHAAPLWTGKGHGHRRIRVAYLSADLRRHPIGHLTADLLETHDRDAFEVTAFSFGRDDGSEVRARIAAGVDRFVDVAGRSDREVAEALRAHEIDVAVDLMGYTRGCRPGILARRPAPVQVNWLGYPGTMGAELADYLIADPFVVPPGAEAWYAERIVRLPDCYQPNDRRRAIAEEAPTRAEAGLPAEGLVLCCFNNTFKIGPPVFDAWMRILSAVPDAMLWLLADNRWSTRNLQREAAARGVAPERLVFAPRVPLDAHLARHRLADLFLDTLPYGAHTTASDALWAGLPLVACAGRSFASRVAGSLLHAVGLPELVTEDLAGYEALALALARDRSRLAPLRARLAANRATAPLFDTPRFCRHVEAAYRRMVAIAEAGEPPQAFDVEPI